MYFIVAISDSKSSLDYVIHIIHIKSKTPYQMRKCWKTHLVQSEGYFFRQSPRTDSHQSVKMTQKKLKLVQKKIKCKKEYR